MAIKEPADEDIMDFALQHLTRGALQNQLKNLLLGRIHVIDVYSQLKQDYEPILTKIYIQEHKEIQRSLNENHS